MTQQKELPNSKSFPPTNLLRHLFAWLVHRLWQPPWLDKTCRRGGLFMWWMTAPVDFYDVHFHYRIVGCSWWSGVFIGTWIVGTWIFQPRKGIQKDMFFPPSRKWSCTTVHVEFPTITMSDVCRGLAVGHKLWWKRHLWQNVQFSAMRRSLAAKETEVSQGMGFSGNTCKLNIISIKK